MIGKPIDREKWGRVVLAYIATPYTLYGDGIEAAFHLACRETAKLIRAGIPAFSPIAHSHSIAVHGGIDSLDWERWMAAGAPLMAAASVLVVVRAQGWRESAGVTAEIEAFESSGRPVYCIDEGNQPLPPNLLALFSPEVRR